LTKLSGFFKSQGRTLSINIQNFNQRDTVFLPPSVLSLLQNFRHAAQTKQLTHAAPTIMAAIRVVVIFESVNQRTNSESD
jgi:hypothetical protein